MLRIQNIKLELNEAMNEIEEIDNLKKQVMRKYRLLPQQIKSFSIHRKGIDARRKFHVHFVYTIELESSNEIDLLGVKGNDITISPDMSYPKISFGNIPLTNRPIIVGFGPSGIFAALLLSRMGYLPIVLERGLDVEQRSQKVDDLFNNRIFTKNGNVLFGEGGAGTFSDGKLNTSTKDLRIFHTLQTFVKHGAAREILYDKNPHVGTDILRKVMKNIRNEIISLGGEIRFSSQVTDIIIEDNKVKGVIINDEEHIPTEVLIMGIGHSARDTFKLLHTKKVDLVQKTFFNRT